MYCSNFKGARSLLLQTAPDSVFLLDLQHSFTAYLDTFQWIYTRVHCCTAQCAHAWNHVPPLLHVLVLRQTLTCRARRRGLGLPDLPAGVLQLILSLLGTPSPAACRLACRALRDASTPARQQVTLRWNDVYTITASASPRVRQSMYTLQTRLNQLEREQKAVQRAPGAGPDQSLRSASRQVQDCLRAQYLAGVAQDTVSLSIVYGQCFEDRTVRACLQEAALNADLLYKPELLVAQMPLLTSLRLDVGSALPREQLWDRSMDSARAVIQQLAALRHLARLKHVRATRQRRFPVALQDASFVVARSRQS